MLLASASATISRSAGYSSGQDLSGIEVGPPGLEEAYLALTSDDTAAVHDA
jgi:hypothetical protein